MDSKALLEQLLQVGQGLAKQGLEAIQSQDVVTENLAKGQSIAQEKLTQGQEIAKDAIAKAQTILKAKLAKGQAIAEEALGIPKAGPDRDAMIEGLGKGAAAAGAAAILLGTGLGRRVTGAAMKVGTVAAIGKLGYDAYQNWQASQGGAIAAGKPVGELLDAEANQRSLALLKAMIAAAKADGRIDAAEQATFRDRIQALGLTSVTAEILQSEMQKTLDVNAIAALSDSTAAAIEIYLVSRLVVNVESPAESQYMSNLATALNLTPELVSQIEAEVG